MSIDPHHEFRDGHSPLKYVETGHLTRLGLEPVPETLGWQDHLNNNVMGEDCLYVVTCRYKSGFALVLTVLLDCRHSFPPGDAELERWLDEIIHVANETKTPFFIPIDLVTFPAGDPKDQNPLRERQPRQAARLREWLIKEYGFMSFGKTPNGRGELIGIDPTVKDAVSYAGVPCAAILRDLFQGLKLRLEDGSDRVWANREERKLLDALRVWADSRGDGLKWRQRALTLVDPARIITWLHERPRRTANTAFTAGPERDLAREIEMEIANHGG